MNSEKLFSSKYIFYNYICIKIVPYHEKKNTACIKAGSN